MKIKKLENPYWTFILGIYSTYQIIKELFAFFHNHSVIENLIGNILQLMTVFLLYFTFVYYKKIKIKTEKNLRDIELKTNERLKLLSKYSLFRFLNQNWNGFDKNRNEVPMYLLHLSENFTIEEFNELISLNAFSSDELRIISNIDK